MRQFINVTIEEQFQTKTATKTNSRVISEIPRSCGGPPLLLAACRFAFLFLVMTAVPLGASAAANDLTTSRPIRIGVVGAMVGDIGSMLLAAIDGMAVAVSEAGLIAGRTVEIVKGNTSDDENQLPIIVDGWMADPTTEVDVLAFTPGRMHINFAMPVLERHNLTLVSPVSGDRQDYAEFNKHLALFMPIPDAEVEALLRFLVLERNVKRIAVVITDGFPLGRDLLPYISRVLDGFGLEIVCLFTIGWEVTNPGTGVQQLGEAVAKGLKIQALINIAALYPPTGEFLANFIMMYPDAYVCSAGLVVAVVLATLQQMMAEYGIIAAEDRFFSTMFGPIYSDPSETVARHLRAILPQHIGALSSYPPQAFEYVSIIGVFFATGYLYAKILLDVMRSVGANGINKESIREALFSRRVMTAHRWRIGPFSDAPCDRNPLIYPTTATSHATSNYDPMCECNSGARTASMVRITPSLQMDLMPASTVKFPLDTCVQSSDVQSPLIQLVSTPTAVVGGTTTAEVAAAAARASADYTRGDRAGYINASTSPSSRTGILSAVPYASLEDLAQTEADRLVTVAVGGVYTEDLIPPPSDNNKHNAYNISAVLDPLYVTPRLSRYSSRVVHITATLEQEIHALASAYFSFASGGGDGSDGGFLSSSVGVRLLTTSATGMLGPLMAALRLSLHTFRQARMDGSEAPSIAEGLAAAPSHPALLIHGIANEADVAAMGAYLQRHAGARLLVPFHHISLWYGEFVTHIQPSDCDRVIFATNLPNWNPSAATAGASVSASSSELMRGFWRAVASDAVPPTPRGLHGFLAQRLIANIVERIPSRLTQETFMATLFAVSVVVLDPFAFTVGPLSSAPCAHDDASSNAGSASSTSGALCETNVGARRVEVRSLQSCLYSTSGGAPPTPPSSRNPTDPIDAFTFASGRIDYEPLPPPEGPNALAIAVGSVAGGLALLAALIGLTLWLCTGRSHRHAPKDPSEPFTIIFTDIQSSTSLWAEVPEEMGAALEVHHRLIRQLIKKHRGYEVKTIGDAFMVAFKEADDAVRLSYELQHCFFNCRDFSAAVDAAYISFDREKLLDAEAAAASGGGGFGFGAETAATDDPALARLSANLTPEVYSLRWSGLRVRVGIHTAFGDIKRDDVTNAYDYYGTVTNTAARVEAVAHGGQVCFTEGTLRALSAALPLEVSAPNSDLADVVARQQQQQEEAHSERGTAASRNHVPSAAVRLGPVELRGLADLVTVYQLECVIGRQFPPLRLESAAEAYDPSNDGSGSGGSDSVYGSKGKAAGSSKPSDAADIASKSGILAASSSAVFVGGGKEGGAAHQQQQPPLPDDVHPMHVLLVVAALFSAVPSGQRAREVRRFADVWRVRVSRKAIEHAQQWGTLHQHANGAQRAAQNSDKVSLATSRGNALTNDEAMKLLASSLAKDDAMLAASYDGLARRLRPVALKSLRAAPLPRAVAARPLGGVAVPMTGSVSLAMSAQQGAASRTPAGGGHPLDLSCANLGDSSPEVSPSFPKLLSNGGESMENVMPSALPMPGVVEAQK